VYGKGVTVRRAPILALVVLAATVAGCSRDSAAEDAANRAPPDDAERAVSVAPPAPSRDSCPVTLPNGDPPPGEPPSAQFLGNGRIWTDLWPYGVIIGYRAFIEPDGSVGMKFPWWAKGDRGTLSLAARRLDAEAPGARIGAINRGTGAPRGTRFWSSGLFFPTVGCWEITARVGGASLTFVALVVKPQPR
jgi:hypothetical protein